MPSPKSTPSQAVLFLPDIIGISQNSKFMADAFASRGYTCLVLDLFNGDPAPLNMPDNFDIMRWLSEGSDGRNPHTPETIDPIVVSAIGFLKNRGINRIAAAGYCLGAKVSFKSRSDPSERASFSLLTNLSSMSFAITKTASSADSLHILLLWSLRSWLQLLVLSRLPQLSLMISFLLINDTRVKLF